MRLKEAELREASLAAQVRWYEEKKTGFGNVKHDFFSKQETKKSSLSQAAHSHFHT